MLSIKETKELAKLINTIIAYVNELKDEKQKLALEVIITQMGEMVQELEVGK